MEVGKSSLQERGYTYSYLIPPPRSRNLGPKTRTYASIIWNFERKSQTIFSKKRKMAPESKIVCGHLAHPTDLSIFIFFSVVSRARKPSHSIHFGSDRRFLRIEFHCSVHVFTFKHIIFFYRKEKKKRKIIFAGRVEIKLGGPHRPPVATIFSNICFTQTCLAPFLT